MNSRRPPPVPLRREADGRRPLPTDRGPRRARPVRRSRASSSRIIRASSGCIVRRARTSASSLPSSATISAIRVADQPCVSLISASCMSSRGTPPGAWADRAPADTHLGIPRPARAQRTRAVPLSPRGAQDARGVRELSGLDVLVLAQAANHRIALAFAEGEVAVTHVAPGELVVAGVDPGGGAVARAQPAQRALLVAGVDPEGLPVKVPDPDLRTT